MIRLLLDPVNLLILDEPTNHLDMKTKDILKQAIRDFNGTVIVVSHDREFLDGLVEKVYEFGHGKVRECLGGIYDFLERKKIESLDQLNASPDRLPKANKVFVDTASDKPKSISAPEKTKLSYAEQRERDKAIRRAEKKIKDDEARISELEAAVKLIEKKISEGNSQPEIFAQHAEATKNLENAMSVWELDSLELEDIKNK